MRSLGLLTGTAALLVTMSLAGCSSDDDGGSPEGSSTSADGDQAGETDAPAGPDCELEVPEGDVVLPVDVQAAEDALAAAQIETTSVDVRGGSSLAGCQITWDDEDGRGGSVSVSAAAPGTLQPELQPGSYPLGDWTCYSQAFDKKNAGGICATDGADVAVIVNPGDADSAVAFLEAFIPTLTA